MHIRNDLSFFLTNNTGAPQDGVKRYGAPATSAAPGTSSILNSTCRGGGSPGKSSGNTSGKLRITDTISYGRRCSVPVLGKQIISYARSLCIAIALPEGAWNFVIIRVYSTFSSIKYVAGLSDETRRWYELLTCNLIVPVLKSVTILDGGDDKREIVAIAEKPRKANSSRYYEIRSDGTILPCFWGRYRLGKGVIRFGKIGPRSFKASSKQSRILIVKVRWGIQWQGLEYFLGTLESGGLLKIGIGAGGLAGGPAATLVARECTFTGFMKCGPTQFHGTEGAVGLCHWFKKMESTFGINEFCSTEEVQRLDDKLRHLKLRDMNIAAYTERFNELAFLCPDAVPNEKKKVELYIKGLPEIIKGETTSSRPATLNEVVRMAHTLMEQTIPDKAERIPESNKRKWESNNNNYRNNNRDNYHDNDRHNQYNDRR
ncbi:reverse transcriptase domain-containing protein [Tanacetum coccineum]